MLRLLNRQSLRPLSLGNRLFIMSNNEVELAKLAAEAQKVFNRIKFNFYYENEIETRGSRGDPVRQDHRQGDPGRCHLRG